MTVIQVQQLTKIFVAREKQAGLRGSMRDLFRPVYRETEAVKGITFIVEEGERLAFIGPNGAGKSTTIKMLVSQFLALHLPGQKHKSLSVLYFVRCEPAVLARQAFRTAPAFA